MSLKSVVEKYKNFISLPNHTLKRLTNKVIVQASRTMASERAYGIPSHIMMEISSACQLRCPLCPIGNETFERTSELMDFKIFKKVVDEIGDYIYRINLNGMGEPTLNHQILPMIKYAKEKGIYVDLYTNFQLEKTSMIEGLIDAGLDSVLIAMDGASKENYEEYRVGGKYEAIISNVKHLVASRKKRGGKTPEINIQFIPLNHNKGDLDKMSGLVRSLGADNLYVKRPFLFRGTGDSEKDHEYIKTDETQKTEADGYNLYKVDEKGASWQLKTKNVCDYLWTSTVVLADGSVSPCCFDYDGTVNFGNVGEHKFQDIWNNKIYKNFRKANKKDWKAIPLCANDFEGGCPHMYVEADDWLIKM